MHDSVASALAEYAVQVDRLTKYSKIKNGHIASFARPFRNKGKVPIILKYCQEKLQINILPKQVDLMWAKYSKLTKSATGSHKTGVCNMLDFLDEEFYFQPFEPATESIRSAASNTSQNVTESIQSAASNTRQNVTESIKAAAANTSQNETKRTVRALNLYNSKLLSENENLRKSIENLRKSLEKSSNVQTRANRYSKRWQRSLKRITRLQNEKRDLKLKSRAFELVNRRLRHRMSKFSQQEGDMRRSIKKAWRTRIQDAKRRVKCLEAKLSTYDSQICELNSELEELKCNPQKIETRINGRYTDSIRESVYFCARRQVAMHSISTVIAEISSNIFGQELSPLPSTSTIGNMVQEMGILALEQSVQAIMDSKYVNLCWDATSVDCRHMNEVHVNTDHGSYVLSVQQIAGGTTQDYVDHIVSALEQAAHVYSKMKVLEYDTVLSEIKKRITSTLSDRAAVNHCVSALLSEYVGHDVLDLNCNIHPLDSLSIAYRKLAKGFESENEVASSLPGTESAFVKVIQNISKMRFKSKGDPIGLNSYMQMANLDRKLLKRYVGNRFHILFELSGNIFYMRKELCTYLDTVCHKDAEWREAILNDLSLSTVEHELVVCGLFGKILTGPWMTCIYRKAGLSNLGTCTPFAYLVDKLKVLLENPRLLWDKDFCCFELVDHEKSVLSNTVHEALCSTRPDETSLELARQTACEFLRVIEKQAERYLPGGELAELEPEMIVLGTNAPSDNMVAESILGFTDNMMRKCAHVTDSYLSSKASFSTNKTYHWLSTTRKDDRIQRAIMQARLFKKKQQSTSKAINLDISERLRDRSKKRLSMKRRRLAAEVQNFINDPDSFKEQVLSVDSNTSGDAITTALEYINCPSFLVGKDLVWIEENADAPLHYRVLEDMSDGSLKYQALYWGFSETIDDSSETEFTFHEFIVGVLFEDITLV